MELSKNAKSLAGVVLLFGGFYGDQASVASTDVRIIESNTSVSLIEAGVYNSINELWSFGHDKAAMVAAVPGPSGVDFVSAAGESGAEGLDLSVAAAVKAQFGAAFASPTGCS